ncbi:flagellin N-terminal helical domain-containing protein [Marinimicrobium koreense]|uniref:flagellin N-terminal helical domain-containing protein n=1 Tax=Marinimicrobium koreense TaxID=306545 RepID=UPI003F6E7938
MALVINTNIASLNSQRQLMQSGNALDQATERLSSGQRINSAKDDAAGLAISNRMTSQIRGLDQAIRNANDGISMIQTAEGALQETTNILQRMRELSVQSANGIYTDGDRETLNSEVEQLREEMNRIAAETSFNGQKLLDGALGQVDLQVGDQSNQIISLEVPAMDAQNLGGISSGDVVGAVASGGTLAAALAGVTDSGSNDVVTMTINGQSVGDLSDASVGASLADKLEAINSKIAGIEASAYTEFTANDEGDGILRGADTITLALTDIDGQSQSFTIGDTGSMEELVAKINDKTGGQISAELNENNRLVLSNAEGGTIAISDSGSGEVAEKALGTDGTATVTQQAQLVFTITDDNVENVDISITATEDNAGSPVDSPANAADAAEAIGLNNRTDSDISGFAIADADLTDTAAASFAEGDLVINGVSIGAVTGTSGDGAATANAIRDAINEKSDETGVVASSNAGALTLNSVDGKEMSIDFKDDGNASTTNTGLVETNNASTRGNSVADIDISTQAGAQKAIDIVDRALVSINDTRAELGAANNRLDFTISNLSNVSEKTSAARSRIMDADFAAETAKLSQAQVLQQASQAMLAQANARPQQVLQLLQ